MSHSARALLPFIPAQDYEVSLRFYQALGFEISYSSDTLTAFHLGDCQFLLQNFYAKGLAKNLVLQLLVDDLDTWWAHCQTLPQNTLQYKFQLHRISPGAKGL